jgi:hypothetical protein
MTSAPRPDDRLLPEPQDWASRLFVSTKVGAEQDEEFVQLMDVIDCLPPGLFEMVISPRPADVPRRRVHHRRLGSPLRDPFAR